METKKFKFNVIKLVEIPNIFLPQSILNELNGRELYIDTDVDLDERIYSGDVFEVIASEVAEDPKAYPELSHKDLKIIDELAEELKDYELIRINKI